MKSTKGLKLVALAALIASASGLQPFFGQEPKRNLEATERPVVPANLGQPGEAAEEAGEAAGAAASDAGAQRPVKVKKSGVSTFFGYNTKYFYRSNPLMANGKLSQNKSGMWTNTFYAGAGLGVVETDSSVITPYVGASWTINDYVEGELSKFNYNSTGAYALLLAQYGSGWSSRAGINYASDSSTENDTEDYKELFPNIGLMKAYSVGDSTVAIFDASAGKHITTSDDLLAVTPYSLTDSILDNWEISASYGLKWRASQRLSFQPKYRLSYKIYDEGKNQDRKDLTNTLSLNIGFRLASSVTLDLSTAYTNRSADGVPSSVGNYDFKNFDAGGGLSLNARF